MDSFKDMMPKQVKCKRDGAVSIKNAIELVRGDIVELVAGDCVPADMIVLSCTQDAQVDNAALTGESETVLKQIEPVGDDSRIQDKKNM